MENQTSNKKVSIYTLGCKVNQYESRAIEEEFLRNGFDIVPFGNKADITVINTCTVTAEADRKARQMIRRSHNQDPETMIIVCGCYSERDPVTVSDLPGVRCVFGNANKLGIVNTAKELIGNETGGVMIEKGIRDLPCHVFENMQVKGFDRTRAYIKIEDGCENRCAYCIITEVRGKVRSKSPDSVYDEARRLAREGFSEIVLTGIEICSYGKDTKEADLCSLLSGLDSIDGIDRIRLGSLDPSFLNENNIGLLSGLKHLTPHFHLSVQSGSDRILAAMRRKYNSGMIEASVKRIKSSFRDATFTSDIIVGFPGESDEDFYQTAELVKTVGMLYTHIFIYSRRPGTEADRMLGQIPADIKTDRSKTLENISRDTAASVKRGFIGRTMSVLAETYDNGYLTGHTANYIEVSFPSDSDGRGSSYDVVLDCLKGEMMFGHKA